MTTLEPPFIPTDAQVRAAAIMLATIHLDSKLKTVISDEALRNQMIQGGVEYESMWHKASAHTIATAILNAK